MYDHILHNTLVGTSNIMTISMATALFFMETKFHLKGKENQNTLKQSHDDVLGFCGPQRLISGHIKGSR